MRLDATAGAFATLEASYQAEHHDGESHDLVRTFESLVYEDGHAITTEIYGVYTCGLRIDGIDKGHVRKLHTEHAEEVGS